MKTFEIIALCLILGIFIFIIKSIITTYIFNIKEKRKKILYQNKDDHFDNKGVDFVRIKIKENDVDNPSIEKYFQKLSECVSVAKETINVLEYLPSNNVIQGLYQSQKGDSEEDEVKKRNREGLFVKFDEYYSRLRKVVEENKDIQYIRVLQITGWMRGRQGSSRLDLIRTALSFMHPDLINHIGQMLHCSFSNRFKLYILTEPVVVYNYMIVDNEFVVSEYFRYNQDGVNFPDEMYINHRSSTGEQIDKRTKLFYEIISEHKPISRNEFVTAINSFLLENNNDKEYELRRDLVLLRMKNFNQEQ